MTPAVSRRELRELEHSRRSRRGRSRSAAPRWLPRASLLLALAAATIAFPLADLGTSGEAVAVAEAPVVHEPGSPTALEVLSSTTQQMPPTSLLAGVKGAALLADTASRSAVAREPLPGCSGEPVPAADNGQIPASDLCALWVGGHLLRGDAAVALSELNVTFRARFGRDLCLTDSYRSLADQRRLAATKGWLAATPGKSNHGWGLAIDLCGIESTRVFSWLQENGPIYGWDNPEWARRGGSGPYEPWHWEYVPGTTELGTDY